MSANRNGQHPLAPAALAGGDEVDFFAMFSGFLVSVMYTLGFWACQGASGGLDKELGGLGLQVFLHPRTPTLAHSDDQLLRNSSSPKESIFIIDINDITVVNIDSYPRVRDMFKCDLASSTSSEPCRVIRSSGNLCRALLST